MTSDAALLRSALQDIAPGTALREGLERIQRSHTGALIVLGFSPELQELCSGGFDLDVEFTASDRRIGNASPYCTAHRLSNAPSCSFGFRIHALDLDLRR